MVEIIQDPDKIPSDNAVLSGISLIHSGITFTVSFWIYFSIHLMELLSALGSCIWTCW